MHDHYSHDIDEVHGHNSVRKCVENLDKREVSYIKAKHRVREVTCPH
jgi:hypothetical protein